MAPGVPKLADSGATKRLLVPGNIGRPEFDPGAPEGMVVVEGVAFPFRRRLLGELDTDPTLIAEQNEKHRILEAKVELHHVAPEHVSKERGERFASSRLHEDVDSRAQGHD